MADHHATADASDTRALLKNAFLRLKELQSRVDAADRERNEPIAIIGTACRFPGRVMDSESFWALVRDGGDAITEVPADRWPADAYYDSAANTPGKMRTRWGGFLSAVDRFDAAFFGIAPREAAHMDPQQRIWLEVAWEALEAAGQVAERLAGSRTGVWAGVCASDYMRMALSDPDRVDAYDAAGGAESIVPNRLSYLLDLQGPSVSVDTACSSALVAVHLACQSLRNQECDLALAGGVSLILTPEITISLSGAGMLAPDGRCKTFDARADGYVRGEGCGIVVLKRLSDALAADDHIRAVIRGSAVNQDGRSNGLTAPNPAAQKAVLRAALANAGVTAEEVTLIEAHGTGTVLGDPVEIDALTAVYGMPRAGDRFCALNAVKANIGHLEGAAGIAGLLKLVAALEHRAIPPQVHFRTLNPHISLAGTPFIIPTKLLPWPEGESPRCSAVSSFGFGGTNAHVVVEEAHPANPISPSTQTSFLLPVSARHPDALRSLARAYDRLLASESANDVCFSASVRRTHHWHRLAIAGESVDDLRARLRAFADGDVVTGVASGRVEVGARPRIVFVFSGQGSQWLGMGRDLIAADPVFRTTIEQCDALVRAHVQWSPLEELLADEARWHGDRTEIAQPLIVAVQVALTALWNSWGIVPDVVIGHSVGEIAAVHRAGVFSLADAMRLACERGRAMQRAHGQGQMAVVELGAAAAQDLVDRYDGALCVAAYNSSHSTVLSGDPVALSEALSDVGGRGVRYRVLDVPYAFHSAQMQSAAVALERAVSALTPQAATLPIISTLTGQVLDGRAFDASYWARQIVAPVRFADSVATAAADGEPVFLEIGGHPVLRGAVEECLASAGRDAVVLGSLRHGKRDRVTLLQTLGHLYSRGADVNWAAVYAAGGRCVALPSYPWQRSRHWLPPHTSARARAGARPLRGRRFDSPAMHQVVFETELSTRLVPFLADHRIEGLVVVPAVAYLEMVSAAATELLGEVPRAIHDLVVQEALILADEGAITVQTIFSPEGEGCASFQIVSRARGDAVDHVHWRLHATGRIAPTSSAGASLGPVDGVLSEFSERVDTDAFYRFTEELGFQFGTSFRAIAALYKAKGSALGGVQLPPMLASESAGYTMHPALLDACLQVAIAALPREGTQLHVPFAIDKVSCVTERTVRAWSCVRVRDGEAGDTVTADVRVLTDSGQVICDVEGLHMRRATRGALLQADPHLLTRWTHEIVWQPKGRTPSTANEEGGAWVLLADRDGAAASLAELLLRRGETVHVVHDLRELDALSRGRYRAFIHMGSLDASPRLEDALQNGCGTLLRVAQTLANSETGLRARLWVITRGAAATGAASESMSAAQAAVWGVGRVIALEHPEIWGGLIDLEAARAGHDLEQALDEIVAHDAEDQIAFRAGERFVARLARKRGRKTRRTWNPNANGTYLITGGLGALGLVVARWLVERGARHLTLVGRSAPTESAGAAIAALQHCGARVDICHADVAAPSDVDRVLAAIAAGAAPLVGIFHAAGIVDDAILERQDWEHFRRAFAGKTHGAWNLHERTSALPLECFVLFSSAVSVLGAPGQANYAAASAFLDGLAHHRASIGLPVTCINWGPWADLGMAARNQDIWRTRGVDVIPVDLGLHLLERTLEERSTQTVVLSVQGTALADDGPAQTSALRLSELVVRADRRGREGNGVFSTSIRAELDAALPADRPELLRRHVRQLTLSVMGLNPATDLDDHGGFAQLGMDSLMALELRNALQATVERSLPPTIAFDYPNVARLSEYLAMQLGADGAAADNQDLEAVAALFGQIRGLSLEELARLDGAE